jgi:hypothetical protein
VSCDDADEMHKAEGVCLLVRVAPPSRLCAFAVIGTCPVIDFRFLSFQISAARDIASDCLSVLSV